MIQARSKILTPLAGFINITTPLINLSTNQDSYQSFINRLNHLITHPLSILFEIRDICNAAYAQYTNKPRSSLQDYISFHKSHNIEIANFIINTQEMYKLFDNIQLSPDKIKFNQIFSRHLQYILLMIDRSALAKATWIANKGNHLSGAIESVQQVNFSALHDEKSVRNFDNNCQEHQIFDRYHWYAFYLQMVDFCKQEGDSATIAHKSEYYSLLDKYLNDYAVKYLEKLPRDYGGEERNTNKYHEMRDNSSCNLSNLRNDQVVNSSSDESSLPVYGDKNNTNNYHVPIIYVSDCDKKEDIRLAIIDSIFNQKKSGENIIRMQVDSLIMLIVDPMQYYREYILNIPSNNSMIKRGNNKRIWGALSSIEMKIREKIAEKAPLMDVINTIHHKTNMELAHCNYHSSFQEILISRFLTTYISGYIENIESKASLSGRQYLCLLDHYNRNNNVDKIYFGDIKNIEAHISVDKLINRVFSDFCASESLNDIDKQAKNKMFSEIEGYQEDCLLVVDMTAGLLISSADLMVAKPGSFSDYDLDGDGANDREEQLQLFQQFDELSSFDKLSGISAPEANIDISNFNIPLITYICDDILLKSSKMYSKASKIYHNLCILAMQSALTENESKTLMGQGSVVDFYTLNLSPPYHFDRSSKKNIDFTYSSKNITNAESEICDCASESLNSVFHQYKLLL